VGERQKEIRFKSRSKVERMFFKEKEFRLGSVKAGQVIDFVFEVKDAVKVPIEYIHKGCGCTTITEVDFEKGIIKGNLDITKAGYINTNQVRKSITVCFDDGENEYQKNPNSDVGLSQINPDKMRQVLSISGVRSDVDKDK